MSTFTYLLVAAAVVAVLMGRAECRPQTPEASEVEAAGGGGKQGEVFLPSGPVRVGGRGGVDLHRLPHRQQAEQEKEAAAAGAERPQRLRLRVGAARSLRWAVCWS